MTRHGGAADSRRKRRATRSPSARARRSPAPRSPICRRRWPTNCSCRTPTRASSFSTSTTAPTPAISASSAATSSWRSMARRSPRPRDLDARHRRAAAAAGASSSAAAASRFPRYSTDDARAPKRGGPTLFAAAGLDKDAPRPLADRLRPQQARRGGGAGPSARPRRRAHAHAGDALARLAGVLGPARHRQDHGGAAAGAGDRPAFRADFRDLHRRRRPQEGVRGGARAAARRGRARCCSSTRSTASTAPSRTVSCR